MGGSVLTDSVRYSDYEGTATEDKFKSTQKSVDLEETLDDSYSFFWYSLIELLSDKSAGITPLVESLLTYLKNTGIIIPNVANARDYLMAHPDMENLLVFVCNRARELFEEATELSLEVYHDPETKDEYLTLFIRQYEYQDNIKSAIKELRSKYKNALIASSGWFLVTTDYQSPHKAHA